MQIPDFFRVFRNRDFSIFSISQISSQIGDKINHFAFIALLKYFAPGSTIAFSFLGASITLPVIIFAPFSGILIDRFERKKIMIFSEAARGFFILLIVIVSIKINSLPIIYIFIFFLFTVSLFSNMAKISSIPEFLKNKEEILPANSVNNFIVRVSTLLAMVSGGIFVELAFWKKLNLRGYDAVLFINAFLFLLSAFILYFLKFKSVPKRSEEKNFLKDLKSALKIAKENKNVLFVYFSVASLVFTGSVIYVLISIFIQQILEFGTKGVGISGAFSASGMMLSAFFLGNFGKNLNKVRVISYSFIALAIILIVFPFIKNFILLLTISFFGGFFLAPVMISQDTIIHEEVDMYYRGRIFSFREFFVNSFFLVFAFFNGFTGKFFGIKSAILLSSVFLLLLNFLSLLIYTFRNEKNFNC